MTQQPDSNPTALDLTAFYYSTAQTFADALARRDWDLIAQLDMAEAAIMERETFAAQFDAETGVPVALLSPAQEEDEEEDAREWCAAFDLDLYA